MNLKRAAIFILCSFLLASPIIAQPGTGGAPASEVSKVSDWLSQFSKQLSDTTQSASGNLLGTVKSFSFYLSILVFLIVIFVELFGLMKGDDAGKTGKPFFTSPKLWVIFIFLLANNPRTGFPITNNIVSITMGIKNFFANGVPRVEKQKKSDDALLAYQKTVDNAIAINYAVKNNNILDVGSKIEKQGFNLVEAIYFWILEALLIMYELACFIVLVFSDFLIQIMLLFFPVMLSLSFIPSFSQGLGQYAKYLISFMLWPMIAVVVTMVAESISFSTILGSLKGIEAVAGTGQLRFGDIVSFTGLVALIIMIFFITMIPMIADMLISGSQSGGFFSSTVGKATAATGAAVMSTKVLGSKAAVMGATQGIGLAKASAGSVINNLTKGGGIDNLK